MTNSTMSAPNVIVDRTKRSAPSPPLAIVRPAPETMVSSPAPPSASMSKPLGLPAGRGRPPPPPAPAAGVRLQAGRGLNERELPLRGIDQEAIGDLRELDAVALAIALLLAELQGDRVLDQADPLAEDDLVAPFVPLDAFVRIEMVEAGLERGDEVGPIVGNGVGIGVDSHHADTGIVDRVGAVLRVVEL